jgi:hypothetical protein
VARGLEVLAVERGLGERDLGGGDRGGPPRVAGGAGEALLDRGEREIDRRVIAAVHRGAQLDREDHELGRGVAGQPLGDRAVDAGGVGLVGGEPRDEHRELAVDARIEVARTGRRDVREVVGRYAFGPQPSEYVGSILHGFFFPRKISSPSAASSVPNDPPTARSSCASSSLIRA